MKYKYYLHNGCLIVILLLSTLFHPFVKADSFKVSFGEIDGHGVYADIVQINRIKVELLDPFDANHVLDTIYYNLYFKACDIFEGKRVALQPSLTGEEIHCTFENGFDFRDSFINSKGFNTATLANVHTPRGDCDVDFAFDQNTLFFNQRNTCIPSGAIHDVSIYLKWQGPPRDLDAHLTGPNCEVGRDNCDENDRFHLYFANRNNEMGRLNAAEFSDDGPESIDIYPAYEGAIIRPGLYRFTVHHFVGRDGNLANSGAEVSMWACDRERNCEEKRFTTPPVDNSHILKGEWDMWIALEFRMNSEGQLEDVWSPNSYFTGIHPNDVW
jgi:hypothetical protein